jgi:Holliday junction resolvase RusA-like endonuclease
MIVLRLPVPPSVNALFYNRRKGAVGRNGKKLRGRGKTDEYKAWLDEADGWLLEQKRGLTPITGPCSMRITIPAKTRGDVSNRIKSVEDFCVSRGLTSDDKNNRKVSIEAGHVACCVVEITPMQGEL